MIKNFKWLLLVSLTLVACNEDEVSIVENSSDGLPLTAGSADFSKYVALGNSLTAGFSDGALFIAGQEGSYANILSQQFALVGGGEFKTPFMNDNVGGLLLGGFQIQGPRLFFNGAGPAPVQGTVTTEVSTILTGPYNNMGIPGAKSFHLLASNYGNIAGILTGQANPYFVRFASTPGTSIIADAVIQNPTFFSLWIGNNDVLSYATTGGIGTNQTGSSNLPTAYGGNDITDPAVFNNVYTALVTQLTANGAKGVVANIPYVTSVPFFTTVSPRQIPGLAPAQVTQLNQLFGGINAALAAAGLPARFETLIADDGNPVTVENNPLLLVDETLPPIANQIAAALTPLFGAAGAGFLGNQYAQARHAKSATGDRDYILLTTAALIRPTPVGNNIQAGIPASLSPTFAVRGVTFPLQDGAVLTVDESLQVKTATDAYNASILAIASSKNLAFVDANATLNQVANGGITANGFTVTSTFVTGGGFSLDGFHPSPRGYALIANKFMEAINLKYGSNLKGVSFANYSIMFPPML